MNPNDFMHKQLDNPNKFNIEFPHYLFQALDLDNEQILNQIVDFLSNNYLESHDQTLRFNYSKESVKWLVQVPNYFPELFFCLKDSSTQEIIGCIFAIPVKTIVHFEKIDQIEINLLCVGKNYRNCRIASILIKELEQRVGNRKISNGIYTGGKELEGKKSLGIGKYFHRIINVKKMSIIEFINVLPGQLFIYEKIFEIPQINLKKNQVIRPIEIADIDICTEKLNKKLSGYKLTIFWDVPTFTHYFMGKPDVVYTWVILENNIITNMISFYIINNITKNKDYPEYVGGYLGYYFNESLDLYQLINIGFEKAKEVNVDVFNIVNIFELNNVIEKC
jgi:hypothetical protein